MATTNIADLPFNKAELPQRDIPRETIEHVADPQVNQPYVPPRQPEYIERVSHVPQTSKLDKFVYEFRIPILVCVVYLLFELPASQATLLRFAPSLFSDSNTGLLAKSVSFGMLFYGVTLGMDYLSRP
jgi:hypothetical protein